MRIPFMSRAFDLAGRGKFAYLCVPEFSLPNLMKPCSTPLSALLCLAVVFSCLGRSLAADELTAEKKSRALGLLQSLDRSKRTASINALHKLSKTHKEECREVLEKARQYHVKILDKRSYELSFAQNSLTDFEGLHRDWNNAREKALTMILTDWKKEQSKMTEMDTDFAKVEATWARMLREVEKVGVKELATLSVSAEAIMELDSELAGYDDEDFDFGGNLESVLRSIDAGEGLIEILSMKKTVSGMASSYAEISTFNADLKWANPGQKEFVKILNARRHVLGLTLLKLDENLSKGCELHSREMKTLGYFSHTSPTEENKSFTKRAQNAKFSGNASGECIFMGGGGAPAAHTGWWYSDGHRLIMYAKGPNTLGIGIAGSHWTLNTGSKKW